MAKQSEEQRAREAQRQRQHFLAQNLPNYDGHEQLDTFLQRFEEILTGEGVPTEQWVQLLTRALTGKPATLLTTVLSPEVKASYPLTKETCLPWSVSPFTTMWTNSSHRTRRMTPHLRWPCIIPARWQSLSSRTPTLWTTRFGRSPSYTRYANTPQSASRRC